MGPAELWKNLYFPKSNKTTEEVPNAGAKLAHGVSHIVGMLGPGAFEDLLCSLRQTPLCLCAFLFLASSDNYEYNVK